MGWLWIYYQLVESSDKLIGQVLAALEQTGLSSNTIVIFTSDHGEMMGSHGLITKEKLYEESVAVPLIIAPPNASASVDRQHLVSGLDLMPTFLDYAGIAAPASLEGRSLRPLVAGKTVPWREFIVSETMEPEARMIRTARYKYICFGAGENREQFFDEEKDSGELHNLINNAEFVSEVVRHRALLKEWMESTKDTFGKGPEILSEVKQRDTNKKRDREMPDKGTSAHSPADTAKKPDVDRTAPFMNRDTNRDGKLCLEEYLINQNSAEAATKRFKRWDTNQDGFLSREEFINEGSNSK